MKRVAIAVVFAACVLAQAVGVTPGTGAAPAAAAPFTVANGAFFNVPRSNDLSKVLRIENQIYRAINHAPRGSLIAISVFSFDRKRVAEALIQARRRGVQVRVLMNNHQTNRAMKMLYRALGKDRSKKSFAYACSYGCRSAGENLHTKMFLFSQTGASRHVVMTGSTNLTFNAADNQYNDLYVRAGSKALYDTFLALHQDMRRDRRAPDPYYYENIGETWQMQVLPYPNFSPTRDPIMTILNRVKCFGATGGTGNNGRTVVRVSMHAWNDFRGRYLAEKIRRLFAAGCDVKVQYGMAGASVREVFRTRTARGYVPVHVNGYDTGTEDGLDGDIDLYSHQKVLIVSGNWKDDTSTSNVWTGSSNWNNGGAKGDEIILRISGPNLLNRYRDNFNFLWEERSHRAQYIPYRTETQVSARVSGLVPDAGEPLPIPAGPAWEND